MKLLGVETIVLGVVIVGVALIWWLTIMEGKRLLNANESEPVVYAYADHNIHVEVEEATFRS